MCEAGGGGEGGIGVGRLLTSGISAQLINIILDFFLAVMCSVCVCVCVCVCV